MEEWKPSESDLDWTRNLIRMLKVNGVWATSYAIYTLNHNAHTITRIKSISRDEWEQYAKDKGSANPLPDWFDPEEGHRRTTMAFKALGWKMLD